MLQSKGEIGFGCRQKGEGLRHLAPGGAWLEEHSCAVGNRARVQLEHMVTENTREAAKTLINEETAFPSCPLMKVLAISF